MRPVRPALAGLFAFAIASTLLAGDGLVLVPHTHALGTPPEHQHGLALYRFPIALLGSPADAPVQAARSTEGPSFRLARPLAETLAGASLILLAALLFVAVMPARARVARVAAVLPRAVSQWWAIVPTGPPRGLLSG